MDYLIICSASFLVSGLTLFSGFGLGTLLMPCFALFFPLDTAVAMTAVVHLAANFWKLILMGKYASRRVLLSFGIPAVIFAFAGAGLLALLSHLPPVFAYMLAGEEREVTAVKLIMAIVITFFVLLEMMPVLSDKTFNAGALPVGGALSGFFGGLSGHQGAMRSAFLARCGLDPREFIGTGVVIACMVDAARLITYQRTLDWAAVSAYSGLLFSASAAAFLGVLTARRISEKVTIKTVQKIVAVMLGLTAVCLATGLI